VVAARRSAEQRGVPIGTERAREPQLGQLVHHTGGRSPNVELVPCRFTPVGFVVEQDAAMPGVQGRPGAANGIIRVEGRGGQEAGGGGR